MEFRTLDPKLLASLPRSQLQALVQSLEPLLKLTTSVSAVPSLPPRARMSHAFFAIPTPCATITNTGERKEEWSCRDEQASPGCERADAGGGLAVSERCDGPRDAAPDLRGGDGGGCAHSVQAAALHSLRGGRHPQRPRNSRHIASIFRQRPARSEWVGAVACGQAGPCARAPARPRLRPLPQRLADSPARAPFTQRGIWCADTAAASGGDGDPARHLRRVRCAPRHPTG
eukprot:scaffold28390_cov109-Isochrysis_galbana.AAC.5